MKQTPEQEAEVKRRVNRALNHIERAQNELNEACSDLSTLLYGCSEWNRSAKLSDQARALWYKVNGKRDRYQLDDITTEALNRRLRAKE